MTLVLVVLSWPRPRRATGLLIRRHSIVFRIFFLNLGDPFHGGEDPARAASRRPAAAAHHCARPGRFTIHVFPHPGTMAGRTDRIRRSSRDAGADLGVGPRRNTPEWLPVLDSCRKAALFPAHTRRRYRSGVGRPNSPCIDTRHKAAADSRPSARPVALGRGATA